MASSMAFVHANAFQLNMASINGESSIFTRKIDLPPLPYLYNALEPYIAERTGAIKICDVIRINAN